MARRENAPATFQKHESRPHMRADEPRSKVVCRAKDVYSVRGGREAGHEAPVAETRLGRAVPTTGLPGRRVRLHGERRRPHSRPLPAPAEGRGYGGGRDARSRASRAGNSHVRVAHANR